MRLVTTMLTTKEMSDTQLVKAMEILTNQFSCRAEKYRFNYKDRKYFEADIDLFDVEFTKDTLFNEIDKLISAYEKIMNMMQMQIDFIAANDDTEIDVLRYEKDENDVKDFGVFVTNRTIPNVTPYYSSIICNAYINLTYVSFGVYD